MTIWGKQDQACFYSPDVKTDTIFMGGTANGKLDKRKRTGDMTQPPWSSTPKALSGSQLIWPMPQNLPLEKGGLQ